MFEGSWEELMTSTKINGLEELNEELQEENRKLTGLLWGALRLLPDGPFADHLKEIILDADDF